MTSKPDSASTILAAPDIEAEMVDRRHPGAIDFVMLGPLTNLALALRVDPQLPSRIRRLVIMGGAGAAIKGPGGAPPALL